GTSSNWTTIWTPSDTLLLIQDVVRQRAVHQNDIVRQRQQRTFDNLLSSFKQRSDCSTLGTQDITVQPVINLSDHALSEGESKLPNKGLNFNVIPRHLKTLEVIPAVEEQLQMLPIDDVNRARAQIARIIKNQKDQPINLSAKERDALKTLRSDQSIIITNADKGNQAVILNKLDYERKADDHISNGPYVMVQLEKQRSTLNKSKASQLLDCLAVPLTDRLKDWRRTVTQLDREHSKERRRALKELQRVTREFKVLNKRFRRKVRFKT
ncbi:hypothetical protein EG68_12408, partial [Paragonimus skrjabini miyazakii]